MAAPLTRGSDTLTLARRLSDGLSEGYRRTRRLVTLLLRDVSDGGLDLRATSLVYTTLLSMAPLLAVSFSVLKAFGAHNQMRPFLLQMFEPLGEQGPEMVDRIIGFVNNLEVGVLGFTGFAMLFYTSVSLLQKIENSFNHIWRVQQARDLRRRFSEYLSVLLVGPVLVFSAVGLMASMTNHGLVRSLIAIEPFGMLYLLLVKLLPTLLMIGAFSFLYAFIPNTRVGFRAALAGGIAAGIAWRLAGWAFARFVAGSAQYTAIYSSFAILIVFMIWLYLNWLILLLGVDISFYVQHPRYLRLAGRPNVSSVGLVRRVGLLSMYLIAERFEAGTKPWTLEELTHRLDLPEHLVSGVLETLRAKGLVLEVDRDENAFLPARDPDAVLVADILAAMEEPPESGYPEDAPALSEPAVNRVLDNLGEARRAALQTLTLRDLVGPGPATGAVNGPTSEGAGESSSRPAPSGPQGS